MADDDLEVSYETQENQALIEEKLEELRRRLLHLWRKNPLVHLDLQGLDRQKSLPCLRFVNASCNLLQQKLDQQSCVLTALPGLDDSLPDEQSDGFLKALYAAKLKDAVYLQAMRESQVGGPCECSRSGGNVLSVISRIGCGLSWGMVVVSLGVVVCVWHPMPEITG